MNRIIETKAKEYIGGLIRKKRTERGISQLQLSEMTELSRTYVNLIENGKRIPSNDSLEKIAVYLGINLEKLISEVEEGDHDPEIRLPYLIAKLLKSKDKEKLTKLLHFVESLK